MKSTSITIIFGFTYLLLAVFRLTPIINVNGKLMLYIGTAALLLILSDLFEFIMKSFTTRWEKGWGALRYVSLACAVISLIVLPQLKIEIPIKQVNTLSDFVTLAGLGISIVLIGFKQERALKRN